MKKSILLSSALLALTCAIALPAGAATTQPGTTSIKSDQPWVLTVKAPTPAPTIVAAADKAKKPVDVKTPEVATKVAAAKPAKAKAKAKAKANKDGVKAGEAKAAGTVKKANKKPTAVMEGAKKV